MGWVRSAAARRRASKKLASALASYSEGDAVFSEAKAEQIEASAEAETCQNARKAFDDALAELEKEDASRKALARAKEQKELQQQARHEVEQVIQRPTKRLKTKTAVSD